VCSFDIQIGAIPAIYIPKLESYEEAQYFNALFRAMEAPLSAASMASPLG
jgi:malate synthase